jgi:hypothetical protein
MLRQMAEAMRDEDHRPAALLFPKVLEELVLALGVHRRTWLIDDDQPDLWVCDPHECAGRNETLAFAACATVRTAVWGSLMKRPTRSIHFFLDHVVQLHEGVVG